MWIVWKGIHTIWFLICSYANSLWIKNIQMWGMRQKIHWILEFNQAHQQHSPQTLVKKNIHIWFDWNLNFNITEINLIPTTSIKAFTIPSLIFLCLKSPKYKLRSSCLKIIFFSSIPMLECNLDIFTQMKLDKKWSQCQKYLDTYKKSCHVF